LTLSVVATRLMSYAGLRDGAGGAPIGRRIVFNSIAAADF
jgi:hypothetical protein